MKKTISVFGLLVVLCTGIFAQVEPAISKVDRIRIAEVYRIGERLQDRVWKDWHKAPFGMLFVTDDYEFLIRQPKPSDEFRSIGYDKLLKSEVFVRPRKFQKSLLATFPAFNRTPLIVVGRAENTTDKTSTRWVFVVLHEHFHQLQYSKPNYFDDVAALNLAHGDTSGMWQINYPFPYNNKQVADKFRGLADQLLAVYQARDGDDFNAKLAEYFVSRKEFESMLGADDYRYASFQLWQEGIARYTQLRMAELASKKLKPSRAFRDLKDYTPFGSESNRLFKITLDEMRDLDLAESQRTVFYPFGAVEGLLLDKINPEWRSRYLKDKFAIEKLYPLFSKK